MSGLAHDTLAAVRSAGAYVVTLRDGGGLTGEQYGHLDAASEGLMHALYRVHCAVGDPS